jgi:hypothetical protein
MTYTLSTSGKILCHKCGHTGTLLEGSTVWISKTLPDSCPFNQGLICGFAGTATHTADDRPTFVQIWNKLTGGTPEPFSDEPSSASSSPAVDHPD